jgi:hypothetical protein
MADPVTPKPLLTGLAANIVGGLGVAIVAIAAMLPAPWSTVAGIVGFLCASLAGLSSPPPNFAEGKPVLQGGLLTVVGTVMALLVQFYGVIPAPFQPIALAVAAALALVTGKAMPALGSPSHAALVQAETAGAVAVANAATAAKSDKLEALTGIGGGKS